MLRRAVNADLNLWLRYETNRLVARDKKKRKGNTKNKKKLKTVKTRFRVVRRLRAGARARGRPNGCFFILPMRRLRADERTLVRTMTRPVYHVVVAKTMAALPLLLAVFLASSLPLFPGASAECPSKCLCFTTTVRCMFLKLDRIPDRISPTTTVL